MDQAVVRQGSGNAAGGDRFVEDHGNAGRLTRHGGRREIRFGGHEQANAKEIGMRKEYSRPRFVKAVVTLQAVTAQIKTTGGNDID